MARRTKAEADETRTKLLDAAEEVFFEKGVSRTSLGDIALRAGASRGAVYWHFKDKVDVFSSMLARICMPFDEICDDKYGELPPLERIRRSMLTVFESMDGDDRRRKIFETALFKMEYVGELEDVREGHVESARLSQAAGNVPQEQLRHGSRGPSFIQCDDRRSRSHGICRGPG